MRRNTNALWFVGGLSMVLVASAGRFALRVRAEATPDSSAASAGAQPGDALLGEWWTEGSEGRIKFIRAHDGTFRGITTCCPHPQADKRNPSKDIHNPKPELRDRSTIGIIIIWKLQYDDGEYENGYVYSPRDGKTYRMDIKMLDRDTVKIRGYLGIPLLGQSQIWKRAKGLPAPATPAPAAKPAAPAPAGH
ncbi:MAG TPA: DUF2147 domain-containing protein [Polyangiales bacterium]